MIASSCHYCPIILCIFQNILQNKSNLLGVTQTQPFQIVVGCGRGQKRLLINACYPDDWCGGNYHKKATRREGNRGDWILMPETAGFTGQPVALHCIKQLHSEVTSCSFSQIDFAKKCQIKKKCKYMCNGKRSYLLASSTHNGTKQSWQGLRKLYLGLVL